MGHVPDTGMVEFAKMTKEQAIAAAVRATRDCAAAHKAMAEAAKKSEQKIRALAVLIKRQEEE